MYYTSNAFFPDGYPHYTLGKKSKSIITPCVCRFLFVPLQRNVAYVMNIVQVGPFPLSIDCIRGGVESSVFGLAHELAQSHVVDVFDFPRIAGKDMFERQGSLTIHRYKNPGKYNQKAIERSQEMLRDIIALHPDIVHIHGTGHISGVLYNALKVQGIPVLLTVHGLLHVEKKNALRKHPSLKHLYQLILQSRIEFDVLNQAQHIIVDTEYVSKQIEQLYARKKINHLPWMYVIPQGIQSQYLSLSPKPTNEPIILSVGSISQRKGHLFLIKAFENVHRQIPAAKLIIAGSLAEEIYLAQMREEIENCRLQESVDILTNIPQEELLQHYQTASIYALHSQEESQGIALVEAMAAGLPVVSTTVGGIPYVVMNEESGLLSAYRDIDSFAHNIIRLLDDKDLRDKMAQSAREIAQNYSWTNIAQAIETLYGRVISS